MAILSAWDILQGLAGLGEQCFAVARGEHGSLVHDPGFAPALDIIGLPQQHASNGERLGIDRLAEQLGGGGSGRKCSDGEAFVARGLGKRMVSWNFGCDWKARKL